MAMASLLPPDSCLIRSVVSRNQETAFSFAAREIHSSAKARKPSQMAISARPLPL